MKHDAIGPARWALAGPRLVDELGHVFAVELDVAEFALLDNALFLARLKTLPVASLVGEGRVLRLALQPLPASLVERLGVAAQGGWQSMPNRKSTCCAQRSKWRVNEKSVSLRKQMRSAWGSSWAMALSIQGAASL